MFIEEKMFTGKCLCNAEISAGERLKYKQTAARKCFSQADLLISLGDDGPR